jgi:hypothetical protein
MACRTIVCYFAALIRAILAFRKNDFEFIVNPVVDIGIGSKGVADFAPVVRLAGNVTKDVAIGVEYYADFGQRGRFSTLPPQQHSLFLVTDFKLGASDLHLGAGHGLTPGSDRLVLTGVLGYAFPAAPRPNGRPIARE